MSVKVSESVPRGKMEQFHEILKACGGRYLANPFVVGESVVVHYEYERVEACNEHGSRWRRITEDVREVRRDQWWRKLVRRCSFSGILRILNS